MKRYLSLLFSLVVPCAFGAVSGGPTGGGGGGTTNNAAYATRAGSVSGSVTNVGATGVAVHDANGKLRGSSVSSNSMAALFGAVVGTNGNVGIGTNAPSEKLEVIGTIKANIYRVPTTNTSGASLVIGTTTQDNSPVSIFGYNQYPYFSNEIDTEPSLAFVIEGNYDTPSSPNNWMESYIQYVPTNGVHYSRTLMSTYDRATGLPLATGFGAGQQGYTWGLINGTGTDQQKTLGYTIAGLTENIFGTCNSAIGFSTNVYNGRIHLWSGDTDAAYNGIEWYSSTSAGGGYGWRMPTINNNQSGIIDLRIQSRQNSLVWSNIMTLTGSGYVGIGTTNPTVPLHVVGSSLFDGVFAVLTNSTAAAFGGRMDVNGATQISDGLQAPTTAGYGTLGVTRDSSASTLSYIALVRNGQATKQIGIDSGNRLVFGIPVGFTDVISPQMILDADGKFGLGVNPSVMLDVSKNLTGVNQLAAFRNSQGGYGNGNSLGFYIGGTAEVGRIVSVFNSPGYGDLNFYTYNGSLLAQQMVIKGTGNVGIRTIAPDRSLEINSATGACLRLTDNNGNGSAVNYTDFNTPSGILSIAPSSGETIVRTNLSTVGFINSTNGFKSGSTTGLTTNFSTALSITWTITGGIITGLSY